MLFFLLKYSRFLRAKKTRLKAGVPKFEDIAILAYICSN